MQSLTHIEVPITDAPISHSVTQAPQQILTPLHDYTAVNRRPSNEWTSMQKVILGWLASSYTNSWTDLGRIFNAYFRHELPTQQGLSENAIHAMHYCMELQSDEKAAVAALQSSSGSSKSVDFVSVARSLVKRTASDLNIELLEHKLGSTSRATKATKSEKNKRRKRKTMHHDRYISDDASDPAVTPQSSAKRFCTSKKTSMDQDTGLLSPPSTNKTNPHLPSFLLPNRSAKPPRFDLQVSPLAYLDANLSKTSHSADGLIGSLAPSLEDTQVPTHLTSILDRRLPRLAFRTFTPDSMGVNTTQLFVAGAYASFIPDTIPSPLDPNHPAYRREAIRHVDRVYSGPTEFISVSRNLLRCLHRALKSESTSSIAVIDLDVLQSLGRVQSASSLKLQVNHWYISTGEYFVHGTIPAKAIISCQSTSKLLQKFPNMPGCNDDPFCLEVLRSAPSTMAARKIISKDPLPFSDQSGAALGMMAHALRVPFRLMRHLCWSITTDWRFEEARKWQENEVFCSGIERGYRSRQSGKFMSLDTEEAAEYTEVDQSDSEYESEKSSDTDDATNNWKFDDAPSVNDHQAYPNEFIAKLHRAAGADVLGVQSTETDWPFASALDIPLIKQEREENIVDNAGHDGETMEEGTGDEEDNVNHLCRSTMMPDIGVLDQESETVYNHCWTGI